MPGKLPKRVSDAIRSGELRCPTENTPRREEPMASNETVKSEAIGEVAPCSCGYTPCVTVRTVETTQCYRCGKVSLRTIRTPTDSAVSAEPDGWLAEATDGDGEVFAAKVFTHKWNARRWMKGAGILVPLYRHPPAPQSAEVREALEFAAQDLEDEAAFMTGRGGRLTAWDEVRGRYGLDVAKAQKMARALRTLLSQDTGPSKQDANDAEWLRQWASTEPADAARFYRIADRLSGTGTEKGNGNGTN